MRVETKQLLEKSTIYSIGNVLTKIVAFLLIPLYARKLAPDEYGIVAILELVELFGRTILTFGLGQAILRYLSQYEDSEKRNELISSVYFFLLSINVGILGLIFVFPEFLVTHLLTLTPENILYFRYVLIVIFSAVFQTIFILILQAEERAIQFIVFTFSMFVSIIGLNIYKVGLLDQGILGVIESKLYVYLVSFIVVNFLLFKKFKPRFSSTTLRECLRYGLPLISVGISLTILSLADRYFLKELRDFSEVGIYTMAYKFGTVINIALVTPFRQAFYPLMFRLSETEDIKNLYRRFHLYFLFLGFTFFLGISLFSKEILSLLTSPDYVSGYIIIPIITFSYLLYGVRLVFTTALASQKRTGTIAYSTVGGAILNILLNILLIPGWGIMGASIATLLSYLFITVFTYIPQQKIMFINWDWRRSNKLTVLAFVILGISLIYSPTNMVIAASWKMALFLGFPLILYFTNFFHPAEIENLKKMGRKGILNRLLKKYSLILAKKLTATIESNKSMRNASPEG